MDRIELGPETGFGSQRSVTWVTKDGSIIQIGYVSTRQIESKNVAITVRGVGGFINLDDLEKLAKENEIKTGGSSTWSENLAELLRQNISGYVDQWNHRNPPSPAVIDVRHAYKRTKPIFKLSAEIGEPKSLTIKVREAIAFEQECRRRKFPFSAVVAGKFDEGTEATNANVTYEDTDSIQVAVRWSNPKNPDIAHDTNAVKVEPGPRTKGAEWTAFGGSAAAQDQWASWTTKVPDGATHFNAVVIYTDTMENTPANGGADVPIVIGSFSGQLRHVTGDRWEWEITPNPNDLFKTRAGWLRTPKEFAEVTTETQTVVRDRTGYQVQARPAGLSPNATPEANQVIIDAAIKERLINSNLDTGYDIVPR
jgi:hypothetical protein